MSEWTEVSAGSGVYHRYYDAVGVAEASCMAFVIEEGKVVIVSPCSDPTAADFETIDKLGTVVALITPSSWHHLGQLAWQKQYPDAKTYAPEQALARLHKMKVGTYEPISAFTSSKHVTFHEAPGTKLGSLLVRSERGERPVVYVDELVGNQRQPAYSPIFRFLFWLTNSGPGLTLNYFYSRMFLKDRKSTAAAIRERLMGQPILLCAHGAPIADEKDVQRVDEMLQAL